VNESLITGLRIVDIILPIGRGQRELILGDRGTGKTYFVLSIIVHSSRANAISSMDGFGARRLFGFYIGLNQNLTKIFSIVGIILIMSISSFIIIMSTSSSDAATLSFILPLLSATLCEFYRDRGFDVIISIDDLIKHAKSYRQLSLIIGSMPSRQSYPANIFNIHSSILERCGRLNSSFISGSISSFPIVEIINNDITEYISTNVISITDGQCVMNRALFNSSIRPSIDSSLSVSRIGSSAQSILLSSLSAGIKNELTISRQSLSLSASSSSSTIAIPRRYELSLLSDSHPPTP
jgi:F-type H+-transporting ATPase subunit alpha